ncbi:MAG: hypothetical protein LBD02_07570 [Christensenellaceae bacterium]|nr:hypothetical protein [Christensenellaceae bacterium]
MFDFDGVLTTDATGSQSICTALAGLSGLPFERVLVAYCPFNGDLLLGKTTHGAI